MLRAACLALPATTEDLPFGPETLVLRVGGKMFALIPLDEVGPAKIALKCDPERAVDLRAQYPAITGGSHLNKKHWNSVLCDHSLPQPLIHELIRHSYDLVRASLPRAVRDALPTL